MWLGETKGREKGEGRKEKEGETRKKKEKGDANQYGQCHRP